MNDQEMKALWQRQVLTAPAMVAEKDLVPQMKQKMKKFGRTLFWRDMREVIACLVVIRYFLPSVFGNFSTLSRAGCLVVVLGALYVIFKLFQARRKQPQVSEAAPVKEFLLNQRAKVGWQIGLLKSVLWWYILPFYIGGVMFIFGMKSPLWGKLSFTLIYALVCAGIWWLNQYAVRKQLLPLKEEVEKTLESVSTLTENNDETKP